MGGRGLVHGRRRRRRRAAHGQRSAGAPAQARPVGVLHLDGSRDLDRDRRHPGVQKETTADTAGGGQNLGYVEVGDWWAHEPVSLTNVEAISLRVASPNPDGVVSLRWDAPDGPEIGRIAVPNTGDWQVYSDVSTPLSNVPAGSGTLYFVLLSGGINVNWMDIQGRGVTDNIRPDVELDVPTLSGTAPLEVSATATGTDPDGEAADLVYAWDDGLGGGFVEGGQEFSHTYTEAARTDCRSA
ncbi:carbohydrate-binding protein [Oerskovia sp. M15]